MTVIVTNVEKNNLHSVKNDPVFLHQGMYVFKLFFRHVKVF